MFHKIWEFLGRLINHELLKIIRSIMDLVRYILNSNFDFVMYVRKSMSL